MNHIGNQLTTLVYDCKPGDIVVYSIIMWDELNSIHERVLPSRSYVLVLSERLRDDMHVPMRMVLWMAALGTSLKAEFMELRYL